MRRTRLALIALLLSGCALIRGPGLNPGDPMLPVRALTVDGQPVGISDLRGKPALVNFWASWCGPCAKEVPELSRIAKAYPGLAVVGINVDDDKPTALEAAKIFGATYTIWRKKTAPQDPESDDIAAVLSQAQGRRSDSFAIPYTLLLSASGEVRAVFTDYPGPGGFDADIRNVLKQ